MKIFIFPYIDQLTCNYHPEGGMVIVAKDEEHAKELISSDENIRLTEEEWSEVVVYDLAEGQKTTTEMFIFPDAGCC